LFTTGSKRLPEEGWIFFWTGGLFVRMTLLLLLLLLLLLTVVCLPV
jgi:hypothetical protein